jgi:hypothetical protein
MFVWLPNLAAVESLDCSQAHCGDCDCKRMIMYAMNTALCPEDNRVMLPYMGA